MAELDGSTVPMRLAGAEAPAYAFLSEFFKVGVMDNSKFGIPFEKRRCWDGNQELKTRDVRVRCICVNLERQAKPGQSC